eukprot:jgi/Chrzof1/5069/Cz15g10190.t1
MPMPCRGGVLIGNWYEDAVNQQQNATGGPHILGLGGALDATSVAQQTYSPEGKVGYDLSASYYREDLGRREACVPASLKFTHGDPYEPPVQCLATMNQLALGENAVGRTTRPIVQGHMNYACMRFSVRRLIT